MGYRIFLVILLLTAALWTAPPVARAEDAAPAETTATACPPAPQTPTPEMVQAAMGEAHDHGFLWRISKGGRTSYLYGTIHVATLPLMFPGPTVKQAILASDRIALELDPGDADIMTQTRKAVHGGSDADLPPSLAERLRKAAERACVSPEMMSGMFPEMQVLTLSMLVGRHDGIYPEYGVDIFLAGLARGLKKPVTSLETPELQIGLLQSTSPEERDALIAVGLDRLEDGDAATAKLKRLLDTWANSRIDELQHYLEWCDCAETESERQLMHRLLDERNPGLAEHIAALHESGQSVFAAVGAFHMIGPGGLPALLSERGYEVEYQPPAP
jgi:uncharacterized protein YbaP (TraB family)